MKTQGPTATVFNHSYSHTQPGRETRIPKSMRRIVIVGGGTAGWMTAMIFAKALIAKGVEITVLESPAVGIIGVGGGSTPWLRGFFDSLGIAEAEWVPPANRDYKYGIPVRVWS